MKYYNVFELNSTFETASEIGGTLDYPNMSVIEETNQFNLLFSETLYEWVDLGLPSGLKWAAWNIGATKPEEYGLYFAWGETQGYTADDVNNGVKQFSWADYKLCNGSSTTLTKYNDDSSYGAVDNLTKLSLSDDAAYTSDKSCRMPTKEDFVELATNTTRSFVTLNDVMCMKYVSKTNSNSIFVPAAGYYFNGSYHGGPIGSLWSNSFYGSELAISLYHQQYQLSVHQISRAIGCPIRPVKD